MVITGGHKHVMAAREPGASSITAAPNHIFTGAVVVERNYWRPK